MNSKDWDIRNAELRDLDALHQIGLREEGFAVSARTRFYSKPFLKRWLEEPDDDILLVAELHDEIIGFLFCRVARRDWAMLENLAVDHASRRQGLGSLLLSECLTRLRLLGISYIGGLASERSRVALEFFRRSGFSFGYDFTWIEKQISDDETGG